MKPKFNIFAVIAITSLILTGLSAAAPSVKTVQNLDSISAGFSVVKNSAGMVLNLVIPAVAINSVNLNSTEYKKLDLPGAEHLFTAEPTEDGRPNIPSLTTMLAIPDQAGIHLEVNYSGFDTIEDIDLVPVQPSPVESDPSAVILFAKNDVAYAADTFYPTELASADEPVIMRDVRAVQIELHPVQYNAARRELRVYRDLSVNISYEREPFNPLTRRRPYISDGFYPIYKSLFANFDDFFSSVDIRRGGYMLICKPALVDSLKALAMWKHQKGYATRIVPTTEINISGSPTGTQIFNYIKNAYETWEIPPEYVMLVGDRDGSYAVVDFPYTNLASDQKYACVDGTDFMPDIFVGRMSVDNMSQVRISLSKVIKYEKTPFMRDPERYIRGLAVGYPYFETARTSPLWARQLALRHGFVSVDTVFGQYHDPNLANLMNEGPGLIWYRGVASPDGWWGPDYSINDLNAMPNNQKLSVLIPITCALADFDNSPDCFGEAWTRAGINPDSVKGGPAMYSSSDHDSHTKWNNPIMMGFFYGLFEVNAYHIGGAALSSKIELLNAFPGSSNSLTVQKYFATYNILGDPELEIRTKIPIFLNVTYPETLAFGLNDLQFNVLDSAGHPLSGAFVTLIKMADSTEEVYSVGKTDVDGNASLSFQARTPGEMTVTVSGQNLYPYVGHVQLVSGDVAVGFDSLAIDDDSVGFSHGNGDNLANPNETLELYITLENFGSSQTANNVAASLVALDSGMVQLFSPGQSYGNLAPGERRANSNPYVIRVNPDVKDGQHIKLQEDVIDQNNHFWNSTVEMPVKAPEFAIANVAIQDSNHQLDPGDTANMVLTIVNTGHADAFGLTALITSDDDYISIITSAGSFGNVPVGDTAVSTQFRVAVDRGAFFGRLVNITLNTTTSSGVKSSILFSVSISNASTNDPTGPDSYGYYLYDQTDTTYAIHPAYNWVELAPYGGGHGSRINFNNIDDASILMTLPFNLVFYGEHYGTIIVCTNGFISTDTERVDSGGHFWDNFYNWEIPNNGPIRGMICPLWDDLTVPTGNYGAFSQYDTTQHDFIIEWYHATNQNTGAIETFEMIIYDPAYHPTLTGDSEILFQYKLFVNNDNYENYATVGIESPDLSTGVQYTYFDIYNPGAATITNNFAILATTNTGRGGVAGQVNLSNGGHNQDVKINLSTGQYRMTPESGDYQILNIPPGVVSLSVDASGYFPGTADNLNIVANQTVEGINFDLTRLQVPESLIASDNYAGRVRVTWHAITDPHLVGYNIYRSLWENGDFLKLNSSPVMATSYDDTTTQDSISYWYYVTALYTQGNWSGESFASFKDAGRTGTLGLGNNGTALPISFFLSQNYPNPFNPNTVISYGLPRDSDVKIEIFNLLGQKVTTLYDGKERAGYKSVIWSGRDDAGASVSSGIYFYRLRAGEKEIVKKMSLIK